MARSIDIIGADFHTFGAHTASPVGDTTAGLVVVQEIFGLNSHIKSVADGYAKAGFLTVAPALFDRVDKGVELQYSPEHVQRGMQLKTSTGDDNALSDIAACVAWLKEQGMSKIGIVGYCWGGLLSWRAACEIEGFSAAVPYYGGGIPATAQLKPKCPVMAHFGELDKMIPMDTVNAFKSAQPGIQVHTYDADHGFNCDQRASFNAAAAQLARDRSLQFLHQHLR
jgi:carboxymethylenebutenolidase